ncbi:hypothetical protein ACOME3_008937 [Neoechinorhynchus agilis]
MFGRKQAVSIQDKTFGLKNKKGAKQQKFIQNVQQKVQGNPKTTRETQRLQEEKERKRREKQEKQEELKALFKPVIEQKPLGKGVDPKSVLCAYFKEGLCAKGDKCKFSHDLSKSRQSEKKNVYVDMRDRDLEASGFSGKDDLDRMINQKHGDANRHNATSIVCKYFIDAVENKTYGWFWECPNGNDKCIYRHCLPEGYVLKSATPSSVDSKPQLTLEEMVENERNLLPRSNLTPVTLESFKKWKLRKLAERRQKLASDNEKKQYQFKQGRMNGLTGREMFTFDPSLVAGNDDSGTDEADYSDDEKEDNMNGDDPIADIDLTAFTLTDEPMDESLFSVEDIPDVDD